MPVQNHWQKLKMLNKYDLQIFIVFVLMLLLRSPAVFGIQLTFKLANDNAGASFHEDILANSSVTFDYQVCNSKSNQLDIN